MTENIRKDIDVKLLAGAVIGLGIGLAGLFIGLSSGDKKPFPWLVMGMFILAKYSYWIINAYNDFRVFNSRWSPVVRRQQEHALAAFPWLGLCFAPLLLVALFGQEQSGILWSWINPQNPTVDGLTVANDVLHQKKAGYLNLYFFSIRLIGYFAIFCGLSFWMRKVSFSQDFDGDPNWSHMGMKISAVGIPATALALTFGAFDLFMSLEYQWFSTMYGVWFFASGIRSALAVTIIGCLYLRRKGLLKGVYKQAHQYDLACLSLAFTVFWAYISFLNIF